MTLEHGPSDTTPSQGLAQMDAAGLRFVFKLGDDLGLSSKEICTLLGGISADECPVAGTSRQGGHCSEYP